MFPAFQASDLCTSLYIHIPFCRAICPFCPFTVRRDRASLHGQYIDAMLMELEQRLGKESSGTGPLKNIYFGGGTPSRLLLVEIENLMKDILKLWSFAPEIEVTLECNPEDLKPSYLGGVLLSGVNRISLGGQSFQNRLLQKLGRVHDNTRLRSAIELLKNTATLNWNLDLMFGIPGQYFEKFFKDLEEGLKSKPTHLSLYGLEVHPNTPFAHDPTVNKWGQQHSDLINRMYLTAVELVEAQGLKQYEISNFAKPGYQSRSNLAVWNGEPYLGIGCGAHSFDGQRRWANKKSMKGYLKSLRIKEVPLDFVEELSINQQASETLMLALRRPEGLNLYEWTDRFSLEEELVQEAYLQQLKCEVYALWESPRLKLTTKGMLFADTITAELMPNVKS